MMQVGDLLSALRVLALVMGDVKRAQLLCRQDGNLDAYLTLLKLLLHPDDGRPPMYVEACCLLASEGKHSGDNCGDSRGEKTAPQLKEPGSWDLGLQPPPKCSKTGNNCTVSLQLRSIESSFLGYSLYCCKHHLCLILRHMLCCFTVAGYALSSAMQPIAHAGVNLNPMSIVETLSDEMPLTVAADIFSRILRERLHRHRQTHIIRNLHRNQNLSVAAGRAEVNPLASSVRDNLCLLNMTLNTL